jgi:hypothetical protein
MAEAGRDDPIIRHIGGEETHIPGEGMDRSRAVVSMFRILSECRMG